MKLSVMYTERNFRVAFSAFPMQPNRLKPPSITLTFCMPSHQHYHHGYNDKNRNSNSYEGYGNLLVKVSW